MKIKTYFFKLIALVIFLNFFTISIFAQEGNYPRSPFGTSYRGGPLLLHMFSNIFKNANAVAPSDWMIIGTIKDGSSLELMKNDKSMYASFGILGVSGGAARYHNYSATPESNLEYIISDLGLCRVFWGKIFHDNFGNTIRTYEKYDPKNPNRIVKGIVIYYSLSIPGDPGGYVLSMKTASTYKNIWESKGAEAIAIALSIRLSVSAHTSSSIGVDDNKVESTYNKELGMEWAHDPVTGENAWVSPSTDWDENNPHGPGYYGHFGNEWRKLSPGRNE